ncbi:hypothetical protein [Microbulbifer sp. SAOS-129_SWC]|uniref:hypothetical protein n=1 Tax=Microbulbifer sp. SAOS-129_SWC TaxID=3145235 RepID=UPI003217FCAE
MSKRLICGALLACACGAAGAQAQAEQRALQQAGPMEYVQVTAIWGLTEIAGIPERFAERLLQLNKQEQLRLLAERQRQMLKSFRAKMENAQTPPGDTGEAT